MAWQIAEGNARRSRGSALNRPGAAGESSYPMKKCSYCGAEHPDDAVVCAIDHTPLDSPPPSLTEKHSGLGIASFGISIAVGCLMVLLLCMATILNAHRIEGDPTYPGQTVVGLAAIFLMAADVVAVGLGIAALCQTGKKRLFGILGLVFSSSTVLGTVGLIIIGLVYVSRFTR